MILILCTGGNHAFQRHELPAVSRPREVGVTGTYTFARRRSFHTFIGSCSLLLSSWCFQNCRENTWFLTLRPTSQKLRFRLLRTWRFASENLSPACSLLHLLSSLQHLRTSSLLLRSRKSSQRTCESNSVSQSSRNSSCLKVRSSRPRDQNQDASKARLGVRHASDLSGVSTTTVLPQRISPALRLVYGASERDLWRMTRSLRSSSVAPTRDSRMGTSSETTGQHLCESVLLGWVTGHPTVFFPNDKVN